MHGTHDHDAAGNDARLLCRRMAERLEVMRTFNGWSLLNYSSRAVCSASTDIPSTTFTSRSPWGTGRAKLVLHLHRLDDDEPLVRRDHVARLHQHLDDAPGIGDRIERGPARRLRPHSRARRRLARIDDRHRHGLAVDVDDPLAVRSPVDGDLVAAHEPAEAGPHISIVAAFRRRRSRTTTARPAIAVTFTLSIRPSSVNSQSGPRPPDFDRPPPPSDLHSHVIREDPRVATSLPRRATRPVTGRILEGPAPLRGPAPSSRPRLLAAIMATTAAIAATSSMDGSTSEKPSSPRRCKRPSRNSVWNAALEKGLLSDHPLEERKAGPDAEHLVFHERAPHPGDRLRSISPQAISFEIIGS